MNQERDSSKAVEKKQTISFRPLTKGLGFEPFSEGLPYAPEKGSTKAYPKRGDASNFPSSPLKKNKPNPPSTGALKAGPPVFVRPEHAPRVVQKSSQEKVKKLASIESRPVFEETFGFFYLIKRSFAYLIDFGFNVSLCLGAFSLALNQLEIRYQDFLNLDTLLLVTAFLMLFHWSVITAQEVVFRTSLGKRLLNIALDGPPFRIFLRSVLFVFSWIPLGFGIFWAVFHPKRRCWHDSVADLQPSEFAKL